MAKTITYQTEKRINKIKKIDLFERTMQQKLVVYIWDDIFASCSYLGGTLKELEQEIGHKLDNDRQASVYKSFEEEGIFGLEYITKGNVRYVGTHDLHYVNIEDFNKWVKELI